MKNSRNGTPRNVTLLGACAVALCVVYTGDLFALEPASKLPSLQINLGEASGPDGVVPMLKIFGILTILSVAPSILLMTTSFTRILIVLGFVRQALGTQTMPPNQVIMGLTLFLTFFTMSPVWKEIDNKALTPFLNAKMDQKQALETASIPIKKFMLTQTREDDLALFYNISKIPLPQTKDAVDITALVPAFMISELKTAFQMGFLIYIPFLVIDMVVSSILMAMGMMMLPPTVVSLPFKLILFVLVDGWTLVVTSLVKSFQIF